MENTFYQTPKQASNLPHQNSKRFVRKPSTDSSRSNSKKSHDSGDIQQMYIRNPKIIKRTNNRSQPNFFDKLADEINSTAFNTKRKLKIYRDKSASSENITGKKLVFDEENDVEEKPVLCEYKYGELTSNWQVRVNILEAEIDVKNHEISVMSGECRQLATLYESERQKRSKCQNEIKTVKQQLKRYKKKAEKLDVEHKKVDKQREYLFKQIQFLQKINFDENTKSTQSYKQLYLETEIEKLKKQLDMDKTERQNSFQEQLLNLKNEYHILQSEYKAMKLGNQVLVKKIHCFDQNFHQMVLQSKEYKHLRQKYIRFLEEYKKVRTQYWALKAQLAKKEESLDILELSASETDQSAISHQS